MIEDVMKDFSLERKINGIKTKIMAWQNTIFDAQLDAQVADLTADEAMDKRSKELIKKGLMAIQYLSEELGKLEAKVLAAKEE